MYLKKDKKIKEKTTIKNINKGRAKKYGLSQEVEYNFSFYSHLLDLLVFQKRTGKTGGS